MSTSRDLAAHLRYMESLGVDGVSRDRAWRLRGADGLDPGKGAPSKAAEELPDRAETAAPEDDAADARLRVIRADIGDCTRCKLHAGRTNIVFGVGNPSAPLMFVGEGPGA